MFLLKYDYVTIYNSKKKQKNIVHWVGEKRCSEQFGLRFCFMLIN